MRVSHIPHFIYLTMMAFLTVEVIYFFSISGEFNLLYLYLSSILAFGIPLLVIKYIAIELKPIFRMYLIITGIFLPISVINYIYDPSIGRYATSLDIDLVDTIVIIKCLFIHCVITSGIGLSLISLTNKKNYQRAPFSISKKNLPVEQMFWLTFLCLALSMADNFLFGGSLVGGGMQERGNTSLQAIASLFDPAFALLIYCFIAATVNLKKFLPSIAFLLATYCILAMIGGSKEGLLRVFYIAAALLLTLSPNYFISKRRILIWAPTFLIAGVSIAVLGHFARAYSTIGELSLSYGGGGDSIEIMAQFLMSRLGGMDDFILIMAQPNIDHTGMYNFQNMIGSYFNFILPGNPFDTLPLTQYIGHYYRGIPLSDIYFYYSSQEITLSATIYLLSGKWYFFIFLPFYLIFFSLIVRFIFYTPRLRYLCPIFVFNMVYLSRSLSLDDSLFNFTLGILISILLFEFALIMKRLKF